MTPELQSDVAAAEARRRADIKRQAELRHMVDSINAWPLSCIGSTAQEIRAAIAGYEQTDVASGPEIPPHYQAEATSAKKRALGKLWEMLATRINFEGEQVRLAAERAELDRQRVEHARKRARMVAERDEDERDAETARTRLMEVEANPELMISGEEAKAKLDALLAEPEPSEPVSGFAPSIEDEEKDMASSPEPIAFQAEAEPVASDAEVLRGLAHLLERGGEPYGWMPSRLRTIAGRLGAMEGAPGWP